MLDARYYTGAHACAPSGFPNPWHDIGTAYMPRSWREMLYWMEYIYYSEGNMYSAFERAFSYLLTELVLGDEETSDETRDKLKHLHTNVLDTMGVCHIGLHDRMCYGNAFFSLLSSFKRFLVCPKCHNEYVFTEVAKKPAIFNHTWSNFKFVATCSRATCKYRGPMRPVDRPDTEEGKLRIKRWSPHQIEILHDYASEQVKYQWRIPEDYKQQVRQGVLHVLDNCNMDVLDAIAKNQHFAFAPDAIYHMKEPTLAGIVNRGWGLPRLLRNYRQIFRVQVLQRSVEALGMDYVVPLRVITPMPRASGQQDAVDPLLNFRANDFNSAVSRMIAEHRVSPTSVHALPYPAQYNIMGGEANRYAPTEILTLAYDTLFNSCGIPVDLYKGTMQLQAAPIALRLFESVWRPVISDINGLLRWLSRRVASVRSEEVVVTRIKDASLIDDVQKQMALLQLMTGQAVSGSTAYGPLGLDWREEQRRMADEQMFQARLQATTQKKMDALGFAQQLGQGQAGQQPQQGGGQGQPPQGGGQGQQPGSPMQGPVDQYLASIGPNPQISVSDLEQAADSLANSLMGQPEGVKDSQLRLLQRKNETLHSLVISKMGQLRQRARTAGASQVLQQQFGPQGR